MNQSEDSQASPDDEEERRKRAADLREEIEKRKSGAPPDDPALADQPNPREFTEQSVREEEIEREQLSGEDS